MKLLRSVCWLLVFLFVYLIAAESVSEARCGGRRGIFAGRKPVRTFINNHRPHRLFR